MTREQRETHSEKYRYDILVRLHVVKLQHHNTDWFSLSVGYANEVGEAFRHVVAVRWVYLSYLVSSGYVAAHSLQQGYRARRHNTSVS